MAHFFKTLDTWSCWLWLGWSFCPVFITNTKMFQNEIKKNAKPKERKGCQMWKIDYNLFKTVDVFSTIHQRRLEQNFKTKDYSKYKKSSLSRFFLFIYLHLVTKSKTGPLAFTYIQGVWPYLAKFQYFGKFW